MTETRSTCPYCGVGCGVIVTADAGRITAVRGDPDHPANFGRLCTKGSTLHLTASPAVQRLERLRHPLLRAARGQPAQRVDWDSALDLAARRFAGVVTAHGPDAVGFYVSGQLLTEDYYVFNKLAKGLVGTNNIDTNSRLCMSSAVAGYKLTLGADAPPACYEDIDHADCLFIAGSNAAWAHPVLFRRIEEARARRPQMKIIVCDPRRTDTAEVADLHLPLHPGTDVMLFHGMLHVMLWEGWIRPEWMAQHTHGFEALKARVRECTPAVVSQVCGIPSRDLLAAARWFATSPATLSLYCQGLNQSTSGTAKNAALINLHLATAQIGRPGTGPFSLTGQPNAMGGREVGGLANLLSAHRDLANPAHRAEVAALWGVPDVPARPGRTAVEMFQAAADGEIRALWIACTNPAQSLPDQATVRRALQRAEFVVLQEAFATTETCEWADLLLPASTWGEKDGTVTNSERRISRVRAAVPPPGEARDDWRIAVDFARRLEALLPRRAAASLFPYDSPEAVWLEHRESTRGRDLDITGLTYAMLEQAPEQWPLPAGHSAGRARLYEDGRFATPDGRAHFADVAYTPVAEPRDARYPFSLITGRLRDQWHGMSRTGTLGRLFGHVPEPVLQMHPQDMTRRGMADGDLVHVSSRRGSIVVPLAASEDTGLSQVFLPMHWGSAFLSGLSSTGEPLAGVNSLTTSAACPRSGQPELKHAAVKVRKAELPWSLMAMAWLPEESGAGLRQQLGEFMGRFAFSTCVPFGRDRDGVLFRAAAYEAPPPGVLDAIEELLGLRGAQCIRYTDARRGQHRVMRLVPDGADTRLEAFLLAGDLGSVGWIRTLLQEQRPTQDYGRLLLSASARPPAPVVARSPQVCTCEDVAQDAIEAALAGCDGSPDARLAQLQTRLGCGTRCGSCIPQLRRLVRANLALPQGA